MRFFLVLSLGFALACGDDDGGTDAGDAGTMDGGTDVGPVDAQTIEEIPAEEEIELAGLGANVDAVQDERGMWHIYGSDLDDVIRAQGYLQAQDRMGQMEFIRRQATGTLGEFAGGFVPELLDADADARFDGHRRNAMAIVPTLSEEELGLLETYAAGVNEYIAKLRTFEEQLPRGVSSIVNGDLLVDWTVIDSLAIARLQAASLSLDTRDDLNNTDRLDRWRTFFPADDDDPRIAALSGAFHDLYSYRPARSAYVRDGYPNVGTDTGTRAIRRPRPPVGSVEVALPPRRVIDAGLRFAERQEARFASLFGGDEHRGSNSWVVDGSATATGNPMLANDPHLALTSPPLFWMAHVNTKRAGGDVDVAGQMIAGTPVNILGFTDQIAWGLTTSGYDVTDVFMEVITPGDPDTVEHNGSQVAIETVTEILRDDLGGMRTLEFENVPHHGLIIPGTRTACTAEDAPPCEVGKEIAFSVQWTGNEPTNEAGAFVDLYRAQNVDDARDAWRKFEVGGQTLVVIDREGNIFYTSSVRIPVRDESTNTYDPETQTGASPCYVLDGRGDQDWTSDFVDERYLPHTLNPDENFIFTANGDPVGVTEDNNPHNGVDPDDPEDDIFIGCAFANGYRADRIQERLRELVAGGNVTAQDMIDLQNDAVSPLGRIMVPAMLIHLDRALVERDTPGTHPDLTAAVTENAAAMDRVEMARDRLMAWNSFDTPPAVEGTPAADEIADSVATSIFNVAFGHLMRNTFDDELDLHRDGMLDGEIGRTNLVNRAMIFMATDPTTMASYDDTLGDSVLWDDLNTAEVEGRADRILRALVDALAWLEDRFGSADMDTWRWGQLHTIRLDALVPASLLGDDPLSIPVPTDEMFPDGFPRQGDRGVVDASNFGFFSFEGVDYGSGPVQRMVVEMTPEGPVAVNSLPGGNSEDPDSMFHRNEMERWRFNEVTTVPFTEREVITAAVRRIRFTP